MRARRTGRRSSVTSRPERSPTWTRRSADVRTLGGDDRSRTTRPSSGTRSSTACTGACTARSARTCTAWRRSTPAVGLTQGGLMDVCLMIEGQEGVTWDQWVTLARACETFGYEGLFRSDHYLSFSHPQRARGARRVGDARRARGDHRAHPARLDGLPGHVPSSRGAREVGRHRGPRVSRARRARHGGRLVRAGAPSVRVPVPGHGRTGGHADRAGRDRPPPLGRRRGRGRVPGRALPARGVSGASRALPGSAPAADHRRRSGTAFGRARGPLGRRVRPRLRRSAGRGGARTTGLGRVRGDRPRSRGRSAGRC